MNKQINILLTEEDVKALEGMAVELSKDGKKRVTVSEIVREAVKEYLSEATFSKGKFMNKFYKLIGTNKPGKAIELSIGENKINAELGRCEILLEVDDQDKIKKIECNCLVGVDGDISNIPHPSLITTEIPNNILLKDDTYDHRMYLTAMSSTETIGDFEEMFLVANEATWTPITDLGEYIKEQRKLHALKSNFLVECNNFYQNYNLPSTKLVCTEFKSFPKTGTYKEKGYIFKFTGVCKND